MPADLVLRIARILDSHSVRKRGTYHWCNKCQKYVGKWPDEVSRHHAEMITEDLGLDTAQLPERTTR